MYDRQNFVQGFESVSLGIENEFLLLIVKLKKLSPDLQAL